MFVTDVVDDCNGLGADWNITVNKLSASDRAKILQLLCEGMSIRAVTRVIGASKNTVFAELRRRFVAMARERRNVRSPRTN